MISLQTLLPELKNFPSHHSVLDSASEDYEDYGDASIVKAEAVHVENIEIDPLREMALKIEVLELNHRAELELARKNWIEVERVQLSEQITTCLSDMESRIGNSLQQIMLPFVEKIIPIAAMNEFQSILDLALKDDLKEPLYLSGPEEGLQRGHWSDGNQTDSRP